MKLKHVKLVKYAIAIGALVVLIAIFALLRLNENVSEYFFARGVSRYFVCVAGHVSDLFPFSVFGVLAIAAIIALAAIFVTIIVFLKKKRRTDALRIFEKTVVAALSVALIYIITAGGCYNRKPMPIDSYDGEQLTVEQTAETINAYVADFNAVAATLSYDEKGKSVSPYTFGQLADVLIDEYKRLDDDYFSSYTPRIKKAITSKLMSYQGTCGITFQPLGEAVINYETPDCYLVLTAAHELAHAKGVMRERDANLLSYYLLITSEIPYLRYCGYMYSLGFLTSTLNFLDSEVYNETMKSYPVVARKDKQLETDFWATKEGIVDKVSTFFNDIYLKLSGVSEGTGNYGDPSSIKQEEIIVDDEPVVVKRVYYSDTARVLIQNGLNLIEKENDK